MYTGAWKFTNPKKQTACFRGYVYWYDGPRKWSRTCQEVRETKAKALKDAEKLKKLMIKERHERI